MVCQGGKGVLFPSKEITLTLDLMVLSLVKKSNDLKNGVNPETIFCGSIIDTPLGQLSKLHPRQLIGLH